MVTSRVEGFHSLLKSHLKKSTLNLFGAWRAIKQALLSQLAELRSNQAKQHLRMPIELSGSIYGIVRGWVSHQALRKVEEQRKCLSYHDIPDCTGVFSRTHGLPCAHRLKELQNHDQPLELQHFHTQWHLCRRGSPQLLREPRRRFDEVAVRSSKPHSSTRREPSGFEMVEVQQRPRALPTCSRCHTLGHTMTSKACPMRYAEDCSTQTAHMAPVTIAAPVTAVAESVAPVSGHIGVVCESAAAQRCQNIERRNRVAK